MNICMYCKKPTGVGDQIMGMDGRVSHTGCRYRAYMRSKNIMKANWEKYRVKGFWINIFYKFYRAKLNFETVYRRNHIFYFWEHPKV